MGKPVLGDYRSGFLWSAFEYRTLVCLRRGVLVTWLILASVTAAQATQRLRFERLNLGYGYGVEAFYRDQKGFVWIGLQNGLLRFDGYQTKMYRHDPGDPQSLPGNFIQAITEDRNGVLWLGTRGSGLIRFDRELGSFKAFTQGQGEMGLTNNRVQALLEADDGTLWVGTDGGGLLRFKPAEEEFEVFRHHSDQPGSLSDDRVLALHQDGKGRLWVGTLKGLNRFDSERETFTRYLSNPDDPDGLYHDVVGVLHLDSQGNLWVGSGGGGILGFDRGGGLQVIRRGTNHLESVCGLEDPIVVQAIQEGTDGSIWVGTPKGLLNLPVGSCRVNRFTADAEDPESLSHSDIGTLFLDREEILWIGTYFGVSQLLPNKQQVKVYSTEVGLSNNEIVCLVEEAEQKGIFWLGTRGGGLNRLDRNTGEVTVFGKTADGLNHEIVTTLMEGRGDSLWVGTKGGGLNHLDRKTMEFKAFRHRPGDTSSLSDDVIRALALDSSGDLWVGTNTGGLNRFDPETGTSTVFVHDPDEPGTIGHNFVHGILPEAPNVLWLGTLGGGLNLFDTATNRARVYRHHPGDERSLSHDNVTAVIRDSLGQLWIATLEGGLNRLVSESDGVFEVFHSLIDGEDSAIFSVQEDHQGNLWLARTHGVSRFDPQSGRTVTYSQRDGVFDTVYFVNSSYRDADGLLYFGGLEGLIVFSPGHMNRPQLPSSIELTGFQRFNQEILPSLDGQSPLRQTIGYTDRVDMPPEQNSFSLSFAALSFADPMGLRYAYRLDPFDQDWHITPSGLRTAYFTNLDPGEYVFRVRAGNRDGLWSREDRTLAIVIHPPFWQTPWAYFFYVLVAVTLLLSLWWRYKHRLAAGQRMQAMLEQEVAARTRELQTKNATLTGQFRELQVLEEIVRVLNQEVNYSDVLRTLIEQGRVLFPMADHGSYFVSAGARQHYRLAAVWEKSLQSAVERQYSRSALMDNYQDHLEKILPRVFRGKVKSAEAESLPGFPVLPRSIIALGMDERCHEVLVFGSYRDGQAFDLIDLARLARFREHAVNAVSRARVLEDLMRTQEELTVKAHTAGMSEMAANALHNVGNTLNSAQISAHMAESLLKRERGSELLGKLVDLLRQHRADLPQFFARDPRGSSVLPMLERLVDDLGRTMQRSRREQRRLAAYVEAAIALLREQRAYVESGHHLREALDLNTLLREVIVREWNRSPQRMIEVTFDLQPLEPVLIERIRFVRVLLNLLENAQNAILERYPEGGGMVTLRSYAVDQKAVLEIKDDGIGIDPDRLNHLFNPGMDRGFGLHYCANVMRSMAGSIAVDSAGKNMGTTVSLTLELKPLSLAAGAFAISEHSG